jgi:hypothetical protein
MKLGKKHLWKVLYSLPSFGSFDETVSEEKNLKNQPIRKKELPMVAMFATDRDEMSFKNLLL